MDTSSPVPLRLPAAPVPASLESLGLDCESARALPEGLRRQVVRFLLRWGGGGEVLPLLAEGESPGAGWARRGSEHLSRDRFDRCRALLAAGQVGEAQAVARDLVN